MCQLIASGLVYLIEFDADMMHFALTVLVDIWIWSQNYNLCPFA